jgi:hypothetical protein
MLATTNTACHAQTKEKNMNFEEVLADLIDRHIESEGYEGIISVLELKMMALREQEREALLD